ncbi:MAG TPA: UDP-glucose 4-epimerase GalE [Candidatus Limnocylindria bacterium]|jgi:UDP-glucose 4-epimerase|nr:UDP-glucose 4-epimerase GalE [Candidatus Limnocylindria bacterium]
MKILITGGAGYIGSVATAAFIRHGHEVVVFDNLQQGHRDAVVPEARLIVGDLADPVALEGLFRIFRPEVVVHFAANSLVGESMASPFLYLGDNVVNALNLLRVMDKHDVRRIILSSTANLFAEPARVPIAETERIVPGSPYGESKFMIERQLHWLAVTRGWRYVCLRYFNAAGATEQHGEDHDPELHLIPLILQVALGKRERIQLFGEDYPTKDGTCIRDYIHVADLAEAHLKAVPALEQGSHCYNLGNGRGFSVREVIEAARRVTGHPIPVEVRQRRPGDPPALVAASGKVRHELGWQPRFTDLETIVQSAWRWHRSHPHGYAQ